jgi:quercetin dioxygenase-like cupin family protein
MPRFPAAAFGMAFLAAPLATSAQPVPDSLSVEWQGRKPCERLYEDTQILVVRCTFPPGSKHVKHSHPGHFVYPLSDGRAQIENDSGKRNYEVRAGNHINSPPIAWHEMTNIGDTTLSYVIVERKYEPVPGIERAASR